MQFFAPKNQFKILAIGAGRGGTSLLAAVLDAHPKITMGFEQFAFAYFVSPTEKIASLSPAQRIVAFHKMCKKEARKHKTMWGNKITTEQLKFASGTDFNLLTKSLFQQKKIIFILRDGRTCIRSKINRNPQPESQAIESWKHSIALWQYLRNHHENLLTIKFEDLLANPTEVCTKMCTFLGIDFTEQMLNGTKNSKLIPAYVNANFDTSKTKITPQDAHFMPFIKEELLAAGYEI